MELKSLILPLKYLYIKIQTFTYIYIYIQYIYTPNTLMICDINLIKKNMGYTSGASIEDHMFAGVHNIYIFIFCIDIDLNRFKYTYI
jgi:hypothetical protein